MRLAVQPAPIPQRALVDPELTGDLGSDYHTNRIDKDRKARNHIRQLQALGFTVTLAPGPLRSR